MSRLAAGLAVLTFGLGAQAASLTINVVDGGGAPVSGFKYLVQQDTTYKVDPSMPPPRDEMLSFNFHRSNHPPALSTAAEPLSGHSGAGVSSTVLTDVPDGDYYVSVLPYSGYSMSGQQVSVSGGDAAVTVTVAQHPIPTAQIAIFVFEDNYPLNGTPDLPEEENPAPGTLGADDLGPVDWTQFSVILEEPAGIYGQNGGPVLQDAFGNPLGTTYNPDGSIATLGDGTLHPDENGYLLVQNLAPGKYGVIINPPLSSPAWRQTSTIEGTIVIDAWVKANEPPFFVEFGLPGPHVFLGFVRTDRVATDLLTGATEVTGAIGDMHMSRPPDFTFYPGRLFPQCWVALNEGTVAPGRTLWVGPCNGDSAFSIPGVPDGDYTIEIFDANLDAVIAMQPLTVAGGSCNGGPCALGEIPIFNWFTRLNTAIFNDVNQNGFWDAGEAPVGPEAGPVSLRWPNGTVYQSFPTDTEGFAPFDEVFPFFHWLIAEVGFSSKKATGATFVVDAGGFVDTGSDGFPAYGELAPQPQVCTPAQAAEFGCTVGVPLINPNTGDNLSRTEVGPLLTQATQGFLGQVSVMQFGKAEYIDYDRSAGTLPFQWTYVGENGGISGVAHYATTRAENDPRHAVADTWEPGIPRVQVALYADGDIDCDTNPGAGAWPDGPCDIDWNGDGVRQANDGIIDSVDGIDDDGDGNLYDLADVDNYPFGWSEGIAAAGPEDVDRNGNGIFDLGDALQVAWSDSWDDNPPTGCQSQNLIDVDLDGLISDEENSRCFDGLRNFNQIRPGAFDGGWAFADYDLGHLPQLIANKLDAFYGAIRSRALGQGSNLTLGDRLPETWIIPGDYIVEAATPPGYKLVKEEDKNVDFGDEFVPTPQAIDLACVGDLHQVPPLMTFATMDSSGALDQLSPGYDAADVAAPFALASRPLCDRKAVTLAAAQNAATNFFFFTDVPIAANATGVVLNDLANEFNPNAPSFGEKFAPPYVPVAFYDWAGEQVARVYADEYGRYNAALPSSYSANLPMPSGFSPNMLVSCMNDAGPIPDPNGDGLIIDPYFDPSYSQFCYTFQYMAGATTYLDTPVQSIAAFANPSTFPVDCEQPPNTPMVKSVERSGSPVGPFVIGGQDILIQSLGLTSVPSPDWDGTVASPKNITRDYGFGSLVQGSSLVQVEGASGARTLLAVTSWSTDAIVANVPSTLTPGDYQVIVTRADGGYPVESPIGVTLTVGVAESDCPVGNGGPAGECGVRPNADPSNGYQANELYAVHTVVPAAFPATPIQDAIDFASPGDLVLLGPGSYDELVILWKPVKLQGWGAGSVILNARQVPTEKIDLWRTKVEDLVTAGLIDLLPGQELAPAGFVALGAPLFPTEEGAGIFVAGTSGSTVNSFAILRNRGARIDGITIVGASQGGAIVVNGYAGYLNIGNNRLFANSGFYGGGVRLGHPILSHQEGDLLVYDDAANDNVRIQRNLIIKNGNTDPGGAGAGISLNTGSDDYRVQKNWVCGNFSNGSGAGIGHLGFSDNGLIEDNAIVFNESFKQAGAEAGGGIYIGGQPGLQSIQALPDDPGSTVLVSPGTGTVRVDANLIRGNLAGAGDGGGIRIENVNGEDILGNLDNAATWDIVYLFNNMITNNVAGLAGGGVSIENSVKAMVRYNTIANNDATATTALAFATGDPNLTLPQPAGIVSRAHSGDFARLMGYSAVTNVLGRNQELFSNPELRGDIVYHNRSFFWLNYDDPATPEIEVGIFPATCYSEPPPLPDPATCIAAAESESWAFDDLAVLGVGGQLIPVYSLLTDTTGYPLSNISADPLFVLPYFNGPRDNLNIPEFTTLQTAGAFDEGGNFIQVTFGPLTLVQDEATRTLYDYHLGSGSPAVDAAGPVLTILSRTVGFPNGAADADARQRLDFDNQTRPIGTAADIGADEIAP